MTDDDAGAQPDMSDLHQLGDSIDAVVRAMRGSSARATAGVFGRWDEAVGPTIAAHARPALLDDGKLIVEVEEPGWATQLRYLESELLERLTGVAGADAVRSIEVRVRRR
jgi:predicted nucleic acid-binding Zn ribbon protein